MKSQIEPQLTMVGCLILGRCLGRTHELTPVACEAGEKKERIKVQKKDRF
jgi:hypothetical protein